jgi:hypothetical protein
MLQEKVHLAQEMISFLECMVTRFRRVYMRKVTDSCLISVVCFLLGNSTAPGNYPEESIQHSEHGESLKSSIIPHFSLYA